MAAVNTTTLTNHILAIQGVGPHPTGSTALKTLEQYLVSQLSLSGLVVQTQPWRMKLRSGDNIQATIPGTTHPDDILVLCAHYDCSPVSPGADDDGSGVAAVLTIANVLRNYQFNCTIRFLLFSGEEQGLLGSTIYAENARKLDENILGVIALDGIGYADPHVENHTIWNRANLSAYWIVNHSQAIETLYPDLIGLTVGRRPCTPDSDHQSFINQGYDGECFREETLDPFYHTSDDTIEHINLSYLTGVTRLAAGTMADLAEMHRFLKSDQITVKMKGTLRSGNGLLAVNVSNLGYLQDTANLTVNVALKNPRTWADLRTTKNSTMNWTLHPEVSRYWEFRAGYQKLTGHLAVLVVTITGRGDDEGLYHYQTQSGVILRHRYLIL